MSPLHRDRSEVSATCQSNASESEFWLGITRRDLFLLPAVGVASVLLAAFLMEFAARRLFINSHPQSDCIFLDSNNVVNGVPNSTCISKSFEGNWFEEKLNDRGHPSISNYMPKPIGTYRIVMIGSSIAQGYAVPFNQSFAGRLPAILSRDTGRNVEVYDEALRGSTIKDIDKRFDEALKAAPDMILFPVTTWEVLHTTDPDKGAALAPINAAPPLKAKPWQHIWSWQTLDHMMRDLRAHSRALFMINHYLYESQNIYLSHGITVPDDYTSSMKSKPDGPWAVRMRILDGYFADMAVRAKAANVPFVVVVLPRHFDAVLIVSGSPPPGVNPYGFGEQVKAMVEKHGGIYIDILGDLRNESDIHSGFYPMDEHLNEYGHGIFARIIGKELTSGVIPALTAQPQRVASEGESQ
jgi:GDSL-like Lipase/Acylhydrolase family